MERRREAGAAQVRHLRQGGHGILRPRYRRLRRDDREQDEVPRVRRRPRDQAHPEVRHGGQAAASARPPARAGDSRALEPDGHHRTPRGQAPREPAAGRLARSEPMDREGAGQAQGRVRLDRRQDPGLAAGLDATGRERLGSRAGELGVELRRHGCRPGATRRASRRGGSKQVANINNERTTAGTHPRLCFLNDRLIIFKRTTLIYLIHIPLPTLYNNFYYSLIINYNYRLT